MVLIVSIYISVYFNYELDKKLCKRYNYKVTKKSLIVKMTNERKTKEEEKSIYQIQRRSLQLRGLCVGL